MPIKCQIVHQSVAKNCINASRDVNHRMIILLAHEFLLLEIRAVKLV